MRVCLMLLSIWATTMCIMCDVLTRQLRSQTTPGLQEAQSSLCQILQDRLGSIVHVDDADLPDLDYFGFVDDYPNS